MTRREMLLESAAGCLSVTPLSARRAGRSPVRVCLLVEPNLPRAEAPSNLPKALADSPDARVSICDAAAIAQRGIDADIFCNSHGSIYPAAIGGKIYEFLARGGSLLHAGGIPFDRAVTRKDGQWVSDENASRELREKLGMHRYVPAFPIEGTQGLRQTFDPLLVGLAPGVDNLPQASVNITTTLPLHVADPALFGLYSVTYLSKPVCRHTHIAGQLEDPSGEAILSSLLLTKTWRNPYDALHAEPCGPWAISTAAFDGPIAPEMFQAPVGMGHLSGFPRHCGTGAGDLAPGGTNHRHGPSSRHTAARLGCVCPGRHFDGGGVEARRGAALDAGAGKNGSFASGGADSR